jgi:hypothetical protein
MKKIHIKIRSLLHSFLNYLRRSFLYPLVEKIVNYFFNRQYFRRYLFEKDTFSDIANRIIGISSDGQVRIEHLEVDIVKGCNLRCQFCSHVSPLRRGYIPVDELAKWFETWSKKVVPDRFVLLGGEPLLHPQCEEVIIAAGNYWKNSQIQFVTNGVLLAKTSQSVFDALRRVHAHISVSKHFDDEEFNIKFQKSIECLSKTGIPFDIRLSHKIWVESYRIDDQGKPQPFKSNFNHAWKNGCTAKKCASLVDNKLYRCAVIAAMQGAYRENVLGEEWKVVNGYQPLTPNCSAYDIFTHLNCGAFPECSICPEQLNFVKPEQFQKQILEKAA